MTRGSIRAVTGGQQRFPIIPEFCRDYDGARGEIQREGFIVSRGFSGENQGVDVIDAFNIR